MIGLIEAVVKGAWRANRWRILTTADYVRLTDEGGITLREAAWIADIQKAVEK